jgi:hypothetical protein
MDIFFKSYIAFWSLACLLALVLFIRSPNQFALSRRSYWHFLKEPWKLATFAIGTTLITGVAPYTGDPTWDYIDGFFMSVLCFSTAPWVVATLFFAIRRQCVWQEIYIAICIWLFSASWSYDIYLVWRDGYYPNTWSANLFASSVIYLCAGLFWNLEWQADRGVIFAFMRPDWLVPANESKFLKLIGYAAIFALPAIAAVVVFFL